MTEIEILRQVARKVLQGHDCDDLWIDGIAGAFCLGEAHDLAKEWKAKYQPSDEEG